MTRNTGASGFAGTLGDMVKDQVAKTQLLSCLTAKCHGGYLNGSRTFPLDHEAAASLLSERNRTILEFERQWWKYAGAKEQAIRDLFEMSGTRYYQILNNLIDTPEALAFDPMLVKRLGRMRAARQRSRSARRLGIDVDYK